MLTRWEPWTDMWSHVDRLQGVMNRLFSDAVETGRQIRLVGNFPPVNLWEDDATLFVEAELPGMDLADLDITVTGGNQLVLRGERKQPPQEHSWRRQERSYGSFTRELTLPYAVDAEKVEAKLQQGVLTISLPKAAAALSRRIEVKAG